MRMSVHIMNQLDRRFFMRARLASGRPQFVRRRRHDQSPMATAIARRPSVRHRAKAQALGRQCPEAIDDLAASGIGFRALDSGHRILGIGFGAAMFRSLFVNASFLPPARGFRRNGALSRPGLSGARTVADPDAGPPCRALRSRWSARCADRGADHRVRDLRQRAWAWRAGAAENGPRGSDARQDRHGGDRSGAKR